MKKSIMPVLLILILSGKLTAQQDPGPTKEGMKLFADWPGTWKGETTSWMGQTQKNSKVEEQIQPKLDGTLMMFEGKGTAEDPATHEVRTVHNALGILSYDASAKQYKLKSYLADGRSVDAWFIQVADHRYQWGFDAKPGKIRYSITINLQNTTWNEVGEYSPDGTEYKKFFEMNLVKQK